MGPGTRPALTDHSLDVAVVHAVMGAKDQAFEWLEKAYAEKSGWLILIRVEPRLGPLRSDSRFADLLERIGLSGTLGREGIRRC
jgi:hypothetical protein